MTNMGILHDTYGDLKRNFLGTKNVKCGDKIGKIKILLLQQKQAGTCISCEDLSVHKEYLYVKRDGINPEFFA